MKLIDMLNELQKGKLGARRDSWGFEPSAYITLEFWKVAGTFCFYVHRVHPNVKIEGYPVSFSCLTATDWQFVERREND